MKKTIQLTAFFGVSPSEIYNALLDSKEHSAMTGALAECSNKVGDDFAAWDGYIIGVNKSLDLNKEIRDRIRLWSAYSAAFFIPLHPKLVSLPLILLIVLSLTELRKSLWDEFKSRPIWFKLSMVALPFYFAMKYFP